MDKSSLYDGDKKILVQVNNELFELKHFGHIENIKHLNSLLDNKRISIKLLKEE